MAFLVTWHGTLLCRHRQSSVLLHRPVSDPFLDVEPLLLDIPDAQLFPGFAQHIDANAFPPLDQPAIYGAFTARRAAGQRTISLQRDSGFLCAHMGEAITADRPEAKEWEAFLPLPDADLDVLRQIVTSSWVVRRTGEHVVNATTGQFFDLRIGELVFDLRYQVPFDRAEWPHRLTLLREGWRIEQICRLRPLVFWSAFGDNEIMQQFRLSLQSLIAFGGYQGRAAVFTEKTQDELAALLGPELLDRLWVIRVPAADRPGYMAARYLIADTPEAGQYQPLLYVDSDTVFDRDVAPMLQLIARSDRISAPLEPFAPLATNASAGAGLLQRDLCTPGLMAGFNTGTLGIPNLAAHGATLRLLQRIIMNHAALHGRHVLPFVDQEIANYASFRLVQFDSSLISPFVRFAGEDVDLRDRRGLVHFWPAKAAGNRAGVMEDYMRRLAAAS